MALDDNSPSDVSKIAFSNLFFASLQSSPNDPTVSFENHFDCQTVATKHSCRKRTMDTTGRFRTSHPTLTLLSPSKLTVQNRNFPRLDGTLSPEIADNFSKFIDLAECIHTVDSKYQIRPIGKFLPYRSYRPKA
ncbi:hypothetical protein K0M31_010821 [Melipona bicolor]|uniref:Uncharacterized protein n=1 Tax=Melipona bicolor TaxID=60889 RepID=A0AA40FKX7_9HYME|nr:hypothetical protein K0M31_010821 [Melipona bicolor]